MKRVTYKGMVHSVSLCAVSKLLNFLSSEFFRMNFFESAAHRCIKYFIFLLMNILLMFCMWLSVWWDTCWVAWSCSLETPGNLDEVCMYAYARLPFYDHKLLNLTVKGLLQLRWTSIWLRFDYNKVIKIVLEQDTDSRRRLFWAI